MHIGLIGGIGPAATDFYYQRLIASFAARHAPLELTIAHADSPTLRRHLAADDKQAQVEIYRRLTNRLARAGAECVVVTSIAGHFCIDAFKEISPLPVVDMLVETARAIEAKGLKRVGILGTRTVMETRFYGRIHTAEVLPPRGDQLGAVHHAYVDMASAGRITDAQRDIFYTAGAALMADGAEAVMLGGTDLTLAFDPDNSPFPIFDCAAIHVDAVVALALDD